MQVGKPSALRQALQDQEQQYHLKNFPSPWTGGSDGWGILLHTKRLPASLVPSQGTYPGCRFNPWLGCVQETTSDVSLTLLFLSLSLLSTLFKINKHILRWGFKKLKKKFPLKEKQGVWGMWSHRKCLRKPPSTQPDWQKEFISLSQSLGTAGGNCFSKCKDSNTKLQVTWKSKEIWHHQKNTIVFQ